MVDPDIHDKLKIPQTPYDTTSANQIVYPKLCPLHLGCKYSSCKRASLEPLEEYRAVLWASLSISFLVLHFCLLNLWGIHAHTEVLSGMLQEGRIFQEFWEQANCLEVLPETLLGSCIENNKTFMYLFKIGHFSIVYLVGYGGDACIRMLCLTVLSVYIT